MFKSIGLIFLVLFIFISVNIYCQKVTEPNKEFFNNWLREDYYNGLKENKTPAELFNIAEGIISVYFNKKTGVMTANSNFHEGLEFKYNAKSGDKMELNFADDSKSVYSAEIISEEGKLKLVLDAFNNKNKYIKLEEKYSYPYSEQNLINDLFFTGSYYINGDTSKVITLKSDGKVINWGNYSHYGLNLEGKAAPNYDVIWLQEIVKGKIKKVLCLHWKKTGNKIELYNLSDDSPEAVIKEKLFDLIKNE